MSTTSTGKSDKKKVTKKGKKRPKSVSLVGGGQTGTMTGTGTGGDR